VPLSPPTATSQSLRWSAVLEATCGQAFPVRSAKMVVAVAEAQVAAAGGCRSENQTSDAKGPASTADH